MEVVDYLELPMFSSYRFKKQKLCALEYFFFLSQQKLIIKQCQFSL